MLTSLNTIGSVSKNFYNPVIIIPNKVLYYNFDGDLSDNWNINDGTNRYLNTLTTASPYLGTGCVYLNGETGTTLSAAPSILTAVATPPVEFGQTGISISFWIKTVGSNSTEGIVISLGDGYSTNGASNPNIILNQYDSYSNMFYLGGLSGGSGASDFNFNHNAWHHIVFTMSSTHLVNFYLNGVNIVINKSAANRLYPTENRPIILGTPVGNDSNYGSMEGYIDELKIYSAVLTQREVTALYQNKAY